MADQSQTQQLPNLVGDDFLTMLVETFVIDNGIQEKPRAAQQVFRANVADGLRERITLFILENTNDEQLAGVLALAERDMPYVEREVQLMKLIPQYKDGISRCIEDYRIEVKTLMQ